VIATVLLVVAPAATYVGEACARFDDTDTIAILSLPEPTAWFQLKLLAPALAVMALVTLSKAIGKVAGFVTLVLSTVMDLRYAYWAEAGTDARARRPTSANTGRDRGALRA
jgi:hypothetical protein